MYKLLIVDDEAIERRAIKHIISREDLKISVTEEASNGRQAIAKANVFFPDIIMMDIKMPGISGLEAANEIKKFHSGCKIIFLTAFNYFEYAQQAIQVGVEDFLIKPANKARVIELMKKIIGDLDRQREAMIRQKEMEHKLMQFTKYFENELLSLLMMGEIEEEEAMTYLNELGMDFRMGVCAVVNPDYSTYVPKVTSKLHQCIINKRCVDYMKKEFDKEDVSYLINRQGDSINIFIIFEQLVHEHEIQEWCSNLFESIRKTLEMQPGIKIDIGVGNIFHVLKNINQSFSQAKTALINRTEGQPIVWFNGINQKQQEVIEEHCASLIDKVCEYIEQNYMREITLNEMAGMIGFSRYYFSKIFKQHKNINFIEYLTAVRIRKAREFLEDAALNIKDISMMVGYNDPNYFTCVFKKVEGVTPTQFRAKKIRQ